MTQTVKRFLALMLAVLAINGTAVQASASDITPFASSYLSAYSVSVTPIGDDIHVDYTITATRTQEEVGVYQISVFQQQSNGSWDLIDVIYGTSTNGMIDYDTAVHAGTYVYEAEPDHSYYFVLKVFAGGEDGSDAKYITSATVSN